MPVRMGMMKNGSEDARSVNQRVPPVSNEGTGSAAMALIRRNMPMPSGSWIRLMKFFHGL